jgi:DNA-binding winged helix-turn-helix (wHTH) protein/Flp pilus assembly protein TadD
LSTVKAAEPRIYRFGPFVLDCGAFRLMKDGEPIGLSPKVLDLLRYLLDRPATLVTKDELFKAVWPDVIVTDNALTQAVSELRQALADDASKPEYVQTVARRGYRFIAPVSAHASTATPPSIAPEPGVRASAVLDFTNVNADPDVDWLATGIAETVTNDLRTLRGLRVIDRVRVVESVRRTGGALARLGEDLGVELAIVGSFQRSGDRLRIMARAVHVTTGEVVADAKADGAVTAVFELQDRIVEQMAASIGAHAGVRRRGSSVHETSSLEAYRRFTQGRVRLEALDAASVPDAIADFEAAIELDSRYALAHVGLANARFWQYERSRARNQPDAALLATAIGHVRRAIELDRDLAEAHATLAFLLVSAGRTADAVEEARKAVRLEPEYWGHHFRLGHATWGDERLAALGRTTELYPAFPFAHFETAMVYIARNTLEQAESVLREGAAVQDRQADRHQRYPAKGLHWLLGLVRLAAGDVEDARAEFQRELDGGASQLYAVEFAMNACDGAGFAALAAKRPADAAKMFARALEHFPDHARSLIGLAAARERAGDAPASAAAMTHALEAIEALRRGGRRSEATLAESFALTLQKRQADAIAALNRLLDEAELPFTGWTIPVEPLLAPLRQAAGFKEVLARLAERAR